MTSQIMILESDDTCVHGILKIYHLERVDEKKYFLLKFKLKVE